MQSKQFRAYQTPEKSINNTFQLKVLIKKNIKVLKCLQCHEVPTGSDDFSDSKITEGPRLARLIKRNKFLSSYKHVNYSHKPNKCLSIFPALKNLHSLTSFSLQFYYDESFKPKISQAFTHCTTNLKRLTSLDCIFDKSVLDPNESLQTLHFIAPLHSLSHLYLSLFNSSWLADKSWSTFTYHIPDLTSLSLNLNYIENLTQKDLMILFSSISTLFRLTSLDLQLWGLDVLDFSTFMSLFENLKSLLHFQSLTLCLTNCSQLKSDGKDPLAIGLALLNPSSFRKLSLKFYPNFTDSDLSAFFTVIQRFTSLKYLSLRLPQAIPQSLSDFAATLSQFSALQELNFSMNPKIATQSFFEMISLYLKELVSLKFETYSNQEIDNNSWVQSFCSQLGNISKLQCLELDFGSESRLYPRSIESLSQALLKLNDLNSLYLNCHADENYGDYVFDVLIQSIGLKTQLMNLSLALSGYFDLKKETVENVTSSLKSLNRLDQLYLNLDISAEKEEVGEEFKKLIRMLESQEALMAFDIVMPPCMEDNAYREDQSFMKLICRVENSAKSVHIYKV